MNRVLVGDALQAILGECRTQTELCDKDGRVIGRYVPIVVLNRKWYQWAKGRYSEEELERIANEPGEKTTAELLRSLQDSCGDGAGGCA